MSSINDNWFEMADSVDFKDYLENLKGKKLKKKKKSYSHSYFRDKTALLIWKEIT